MAAGAFGELRRTVNGFARADDLEAAAGLRKQRFRLAQAPLCERAEAVAPQAGLREAGANPMLTSEALVQKLLSGVVGDQGVSAVA